MTPTLGYTIFYVADVPATLEFFTAAFGFERTMLVPDSSYGELATGPTTLAFASLELVSSSIGPSDEFITHDPAGPPVAASITLLSDDVQSTYDAAVAAGATAYVAPATKPWGQVVSYVRDLNGILVEIASPMG